MVDTSVSACSGQPRFAVICNPENRRVRFFQEVLARFALPPASILAYDELIRSPGSLADRLAGAAVLRIESPGEDFEVEKELLCKGAKAAAAEGTPFLTPQQIAELLFDRGLVLYPRQWYLGFQRVLNDWSQALAAIPVQVMNHPHDIAVMFDKVRCHERLRQNGVPVPRSLGPIESYDQLLSRMQETGDRRVFLKLSHGSSASGVVAFSHSGRHAQAITTAELVRTGGSVRLYNSLKLRRYVADHDVADVIDTLCRQRVHVEQWLPKAHVDDKPFDLRIVVIGGKARHAVVRQSESPLTNLHLGNQRGDLRQVQSLLGDEWRRVCRTCERVMQLFPRSLNAGVDMVVAPNLREHAVLEVNAFGDLLPGVLDRGQDTYAAEVEAALAVFASSDGAKPA